LFLLGDALAKDTKAVDLLTEIILSIFRLNAQLLEKGDRLVKPLTLTSARWQVLGAIAIAGAPQTAPQIAAAMGITRQGVQKQLNWAIAEGLIELLANPRHERSPLHTLTENGRTAYDAAMSLQRKWARSLGKGLPLAELDIARQMLTSLENRLDSTALPSLRDTP
jgi:DNA-binding MarR family transcriptional regulator